MAVLFYQLFIVASLLLLRLFGSRALLIGAAIWSCLSVANLFSPPLIALQLAVVWITYSVLAPQKKPEPTSPPTASRRPGAIVGASSVGHAQRFDAAISQAPPPWPDWSEPWGASELSHGPAVSGPLLKQRAMLDLERSFIALFLGRAVAHKEHEEFLETADDRMVELHRAELGRRSSAAWARPGDQTSSKYGDFDFAAGDCPQAHDPDKQAMLQTLWTKANEDHAVFIAGISEQLNRDDCLRLAFMDVALRHDAGSLLRRLEPRRFLIKTSDKITEWFAANSPATGLGRLESARLGLERLERHSLLLRASSVKAAASHPAAPTVNVDANNTAATAVPASYARRDAPTSPEAEAIRRIAMDRKVPYLVHFTAAANLESILRLGLQSRVDAEGNGITPFVNDTLRLDRRRDASSTSVAFPNAAMFWKYRQENPKADWAVLLIDPAVIWTQRCYFCRHNAADSRIIQAPAEELATASAFAAMFDEMEGGATRQALNLSRFDPTDPQAEVMVLGVIPPDAITTIIFNDPALANKYRPIVQGRAIQLNEKTRGFFAQRSFTRSGWAPN